MKSQQVIEYECFVVASREMLISKLSVQFVFGTRHTTPRSCCESVPVIVRIDCMWRVGLCESTFLRLEYRYSVEIRIEYSSIRPIPEVAITYRVSQNKRTPGSSFKLVIQEQFETSQNNDRILMLRKDLSSELAT